MLTRRHFVSASAAALLSACAPARPVAELPEAAPDWPPLPARYGAVQGEPYPVPAVPEGVVAPHLWRQEVPNPFPQEVQGTIIVNPLAGFLYLVQDADRALRYGAGTGAEAFAWTGAARLQFARKWPVWKAPDTMIARRPEFAPYSVANGGMPPGPGNPLGARALYLFQNGQDTLYRIHGACEPEYLGKAVSSGCIRLLDQDAIDLYDRAPHGAKVVVLSAAADAAMKGLY
ncbi:L,D-transpeptidase [Pseudotabrizicola sp. L79]|uniref:L,D-transpeptidase n=1 Tax=Pseudotabrizicola sp. L79 TaxID=3118402 RepID=UPI002F93F3B5